MRPVCQGRSVNVSPSIVLSLSGYRAEISRDKWAPDSYVLTVGGTPQSQVSLSDPSELFFEYVRRMGHVIDEVRKRREPITAVHLGGGALTLPRYIDATRPGSRQQVIELERDLIDFVREHLPWDKRAAIRVRYGDARETLSKLPAAIHGKTDVVVVDVFGGARIPVHVTTQEFYEEVAALLAPDGVVLVNAADGPPLSFARGQAATLKEVYGDVAVLADTGMLKGRRYGNVVLVASHEPLPLEWMPRLLANGPHPSKVVTGRELTNWIAGAPVVTDANATPTPTPSSSLFL